MTTDPTSLHLVHAVPGSADVVVERHTYDPAAPLAFELYRSPHAPRPSPAVVFVSGLPDPGVVQFFGKPFKDWASHVDWARAVAASGVVGITYANREPGDVVALVRHLRAHAGELGLDPARIGIWAGSGNVPTALGLIAHERPACAALLYGYLLDLDGATAVADGAARFYFAVPPVTLADLPRDVPILIVRAGRDTTPGLDAGIVAFVAAARAGGLAVRVVEHADGVHAFDLIDDSPRAHAVVEEVLVFLRAALGAR